MIFTPQSGGLNFNVDIVSSLPPGGGCLARAVSGVSIVGSPMQINFSSGNWPGVVAGQTYFITISPTVGTAYLRSPTLGGTGLSSWNGTNWLAQVGNAVMLNFVIGNCN